MGNDVKPALLAATDVLILCGGLGSRLRPIVPDRPKALVPIGGRPLLDILVEDLVQQTFRRIIFCVGYLGDQIIAHYRDRKEAGFAFSVESTPLGTGGAVMNALPLVRSGVYAVLNGDSLCRVNFDEFHRFHESWAADLSIVVAKNLRNDGGTVRLGKEQRVLQFSEKAPADNSATNFINAGIYFIRKKSIDLTNFKVPFSLEHDVFPALMQSKRCFGFVVEGAVLDIGTPERYQRANEKL